MKMFRAVAVVACFLSLATHARAAGPEANPEDVQEAKVRFEAGEAAFKAGRFREALGEFQGGYVLTRNPGFLLNIAVCYRKMGEDQQALDNFRDFVKQAPDSPRRGEVEKQIAELERKLGPATPLVSPAADPARLADGSRDPAAPLPPPKPAAAPVAAPVRTAPPARTPPRVPQSAAVDSADEDDGVALVVSSRRRDRRAAAPTVRDEAEAESGGNGRIWLYGGLAVAVLAGVAVAFALSGGDKSVTPTLGVVDLR